MEQVFSIELLSAVLWPSFCKRRNQLSGSSVLEVRSQPIVFLKEELQAHSNDGQQRALDRIQHYPPHPHPPSTPMLSPMTEVVGHLHSMAGSHEVMPLSYV